jgi:predicted peptidase
MRKTVTILILSLICLGLLGGCGKETAEDVAPQESAPVVESVVAEELSEVPQPVPTPSAAAEIQESVVEEATAEGSSVEEPEAFSLDDLFKDYWEEPSVADMYAQVADQFQQKEYVDLESGLTISYNLYIPEQASSEPCPMVMFISDSSVVGTDVTAPLTQGYGGIIWATQTEQAKHPSYVLVPQYPEIIIDDNRGTTVTDYVEATARMVQAVAAENNVDEKRIYTTGQSMGCMTSLYLASAHPELFAAELFVSGQWQMEDLENLDTQTFCYVAAGGDPKASQGQADVMADLDTKGVSYNSSFDWDANLGDDDMEPVLRELLDSECAIHIGQFAAGTVVEANPDRGMEHLSSFDCAYKLDALRNWLFAQSK